MILDEIIEAKKLDLDMEEKALPLIRLMRQATSAPAVRDFRSALAAPDLSVIAEVKRASHSAGMIAGGVFDPAQTARQYEAGGAAAVSVLTERHWFMGSDRYLTQVRDDVNIPVLRKDFIFCERQVVGARAIGADAILLIAAILDDGTMERLFLLAQEYGMQCLIETHSSEEIRRAVGCGADIIGINNRNLGTMQVELSTFEQLRPHIPAGVLAVAESGIRSLDDAARMRAAGADAVLVGEMLMRSGNIQDALAELRSV